MYNYIIYSNYRNILFIDYNDRYIVIDTSSKYTANNIKKNFTRGFKELWLINEKDSSINKKINLPSQFEERLSTYIKEMYGEKDPDEYASKK